MGCGRAEEGWLGFGGMLVFIGILLVALIYLWRVGADPTILADIVPMDDAVRRSVVMARLDPRGPPEFVMAIQLRPVLLLCGDGHEPYQPRRHREVGSGGSSRLAPERRMWLWRHVLSPSMWQELCVLLG